MRLRAAPAPATGPASGPAAPGGASSETVVAYDFLRPTKLPRDQMRLLYLCLETFTRRLTTLLTSGLRQVSQVDLVTVEQMAYDEYIGTLPSPTMLAPITLDPLPGTAILQFAVHTALTCVDHLLGGPGGEQPDRLPTEVESALLRGLLEKMLGVLRYALQPAVTLLPTLGTLEYNPQFAQAAGPSDPMMVARMRFAVGADLCEATLCLPLNGLGPRLAASLAHTNGDANGDSGRSESARRLQSTVSTAPVPVSVGFRPVIVDPMAVLGLKVGDVIPLRHRVTDPLVVSTGGQVCATALAGRAGEELAALIVDPPEKLA